jgi:hypothetical protein
MGYTVTIDPATNASTFEESWQLLNDGVPIDLTGAIITFNLQDPVTESTVLRVSSEDGGIFITDVDFTVRVEKDQMAGLIPKNYYVGLTVDFRGDVIQLFEGTLQVLNGRMQ